MPLVPLIGADQNPYTVSFQGPDAIVDFSSNLGIGAVGPTFAPQEIVGPNAARAGFLLQNTSAHAMLIAETNTEAQTSYFIVNPGEYWPPRGVSFPVPQGQITVVGGPDSVAGDTFAARSWPS